MNENGNPPTLRASQPANRNAMKSGVYSARARAELVAEIRAAADGISTVALVVAALRAEPPRLDGLRQALDRDIEEHGPSTRSGAAREQFTQRSSVVRQLDKLELCWAMSDPVDGAAIDDGLDQDPAAGALRDRLLGLLAHRDLLDRDLEHRGASTKKGGLRRQVADRVRVSRELVRLADSIRTEIRRARSAVAPSRLWDVARGIAFDPGERPGDVITAIRHLLTRPAPPPKKSTEELAYEAKVRAMNEEEVNAELAEVEAALAEIRASDPATHRDLDQAHVITNEPSAHGEALKTRCLEILRRIGDGVDTRATARDRMSAAELRERYLSHTDRDPLSEEVDSWDEAQLDREMEDLTRPFDDDSY
jgi:hypothetical protein